MYYNSEDRRTFSVGGVLTLVAPERFEFCVHQTVEPHVGQRLEHLFTHGAGVQRERGQLAAPVRPGVFVDVLINHMNLANRSMPLINIGAAGTTTVNSYKDEGTSHSIRVLDNNNKNPVHQLPPSQKNTPPPHPPPLLHLTLEMLCECCEGTALNTPPTHPFHLFK